MQTARFLVTGYPGAGKTTFIETITGSGDDFGEISISEQLTIQLEAADADEPEEWQAVISGALGAVLLVNGTHDFQFEGLQALMDEMRKIRKVQFIIGVTHQDVSDVTKPNALRAFLPENTDVKVFPVITTERQSAENVLLALIYQILS